MLFSRFIDNPTKLSTITMIHEAMHAGNVDVRDKGYIHQDFFQGLAEDVKITNAAHFEVVPRRILNAQYSFAGKTFIPAGTSVGGEGAPMTPMQKAIWRASETLRQAWTTGVRLHLLYTELYKNQTQWRADKDGGRTFATALPYWSKVEGMTIHLRLTDIDATSQDVAKLPISQIDLALSEGVTRKLLLASRQISKGEEAANTLEVKNSTEQEREAAHRTPDAHEAFLIRLVIKGPPVAPITDGVDRDIRVVRELAMLDWNEALTAREPNSFSD